jgi:hypothetical protein
MHFNRHFVIEKQVNNRVYHFVKLIQHRRKRLQPTNGIDDIRKSGEKKTTSENDGTRNKMKPRQNKIKIKTEEDQARKRGQVNRNKITERITARKQQNVQPQLCIIHIVISPYCCKQCELQPRMCKVLKS